REREGGSPRDVSPTGRSEKQRADNESDSPHRQHFQHANRRERGERLYWNHDRGILPRHGLRCGVDGGLDKPLGRGHARDIRTTGRDARRRRISRLSRVKARRVLRKIGKGRSCRVRDPCRINLNRRRSLTTRWRLFRARDTEHTENRKGLLVPRHGPRLQTPLPGHQLAHKLLALHRHSRRVVPEGEWTRVEHDAERGKECSTTGGYTSEQR